MQRHQISKHLSNLKSEISHDMAYNPPSLVLSLSRDTFSQIFIGFREVLKHDSYLINGPSCEFFWQTKFAVSVSPANDNHIYFDLHMHLHFANNLCC